MSRPRSFGGLERRKWIFAGLALAPVLAIFGAVRLYPIAETLRLSLFQWNILSRNKPFVGLQNFIDLASDELFLEALRNTAIIAFGVLGLTVPLAMGLAALIHRRAGARLSGFYETAVFLPHVVSLVPSRFGDSTRVRGRRRPEFE